METVFESMEEGVIVVDENADVLFFNAGAAKIGGTGNPNPDVNQWALMHGIYRPDKETHLPVEENPLMLAMRGRPTDGVEVFVRNELQPEGVFVSVNGRPLKDHADTPSGGVVVFQDVTRRKEAEVRLAETVRDLREQSELLQAIFDSVGEGLVVSDHSGEFLYINPAAEAMLGEELYPPPRQMARQDPQHLLQRGPRDAHRQQGPAPPPGHLRGRVHRRQGHIRAQAEPSRGRHFRPDERPAVARRCRRHSRRHPRLPRRHPPGAGRRGGDAGIHAGPPGGGRDRPPRHRQRHQQRDRGASTPSTRIFRKTGWRRGSAPWPML